MNHWIMRMPCRCILGVAYAKRPVGAAALLLGGVRLAAGMSIELVTAQEWERLRPTALKHTCDDAHTFGGES